MVNYEVVRATEDHAIEVAVNMRDADATEIYFQSMATPYDAMMECLNSDVALTCLVEDEPAFMFGVNNQGLLGDRGTVWMLGTDNIDKIHFGKRELKLMREYVRAMLEGYSMIENYVHDENELSKKWLKFLGFELEEPRPYGIYQKPFRHFVMRAE